MENKICKRCCEEIGVKAKICPFCQSPQTKFEAFFDQKFIWAAFWLVVFFIAVPVYFYKIETRPYLYDSSLVSTKHISSEIHEMDCGKRISVLAEVQNNSELDLKDLIFQILIVDSSGSLVSTYSDSHFNLILPSGMKKKIELTGYSTATNLDEMNFVIELSKADVDSRLF